jgi:hypothetical protein
MAPGVFSCTGILNLGNQKTTVYCIPYGAFYALVGNDAIDNQILNAKIAQNIFDAGAIRNA